MSKKSKRVSVFLFDDSSWRNPDLMWSHLDDTDTHKQRIIAFSGHTRPRLPTSALV